MPQGELQHPRCLVSHGVFLSFYKMPEQTGKKTKGKKSDLRRKGRDGRKNSPEKKEKRKSVNETVLGQLGKSDFMDLCCWRLPVLGSRVKSPSP